MHSSQTVEKGAFPPWPPLRGGSARRRWGREPCDNPTYFGLWKGSLPPALRGHLPRRGRQGSVFYTFHNLLPKNFYKKSEKTV